MYKSKFTFGLILEAVSSALFFFSFLLPWFNFSPVRSSSIFMTLLEKTNDSTATTIKVVLILMMLLCLCNTIIKCLRYKSIVVSCIIIGMVFIGILFPIDKSETLLGTFISHFDEFIQIIGLGEYLAFGAIIGLIAGTIVSKKSAKHDTDQTECNTWTGDNGYVLEIIGTAFLFVSMILPWGIDKYDVVLSSPLTLITQNHYSTFVGYLLLLLLLFCAINIAARKYIGSSIFSAVIILEFFLFCILLNEPLTNTICKSRVQFENIGIYFSVFAIILLLTGIITSKNDKEAETEGTVIIDNRYSFQKAFVLSSSVYFIAFVAMYLATLIQNFLSFTLFGYLFIATTLTYIIVPVFLSRRKLGNIAPSTFLLVWAVAFVCSSIVNTISTVEVISNPENDIIFLTEAMINLTSLLIPFAIRDKRTRYISLALVLLFFSTRTIFFSQFNLLTAFIAVAVAVLLSCFLYYQQKPTHAGPRRMVVLSVFGRKIRQSRFLFIFLLVFLLLDIALMVMYLVCENYFINSNGVYQEKVYHYMVRLSYCLWCLVLPFALSNRKQRQVMYAVIAPYIIWCIINVHYFIISTIILVIGAIVLMMINKNLTAIIDEEEQKPTEIPAKPQSSSIKAASTNKGSVSWIQRNRRWIFPTGIGASVALLVVGAYFLFFSSENNPLGLEVPRCEKFVRITKGNVIVYKGDDDNSPKLIMAENPDYSEDLYYLWEDENADPGYTISVNYLNKDQVLPVFEESNGMYKVQVELWRESREGYISKDCCEEVEPTPITEEILEKIDEENGESRHYLVKKGKYKNLCLKSYIHEEEGFLGELLVIGELKDGVLLYSNYDCAYLENTNSEVIEFESPNRITYGASHVYKAKNKERTVLDTHKITDDLIEELLHSLKETHTLFISADYYFPGINEYRNLFSYTFPLND